MTLNTEQALVDTAGQDLEAGFDQIQTSEDSLLEDNGVEIGVSIKIAF